MLKLSPRWVLLTRLALHYSVFCSIPAQELTLQLPHLSFTPQAAHHWYNGEKRSARVFLPEMDEARELISSLVRTVLSEREVSFVVLPATSPSADDERLIILSRRRGIRWNGRATGSQTLQLPTATEEPRR